MRFRGIWLIAVMSVLTLLAGCRTATHISREEQLAHVTNPPTTAAVAEESEVLTTVLATEATTLPGDTEESTLAPEPTKPPSTKATKPPKTTPPETTAVTEPAVTEPEEEHTEPTAGEPDPYDISGHACGALEYAIADAINAERREEGLPELTLNHRLSAISSVRGYEISNSFSHTRPNGGGFSTVLTDYGYGYTQAGENLLQCSDGYSAADMVALWMGSAGHKANILNPEAVKVGVGIYRSGEVVYVAVIFTD